MIGRSLAEFDEMSKIKLESSKHIKSEALLQAREFGLTGAIQPFDLDLHAGEVVGLAGFLVRVAQKQPVFYLGSKNRIQARLL